MNITKIIDTLIERFGGFEVHNENAYCVFKENACRGEVNAVQMEYHNGTLTIAAYCEEDEVSYAIVRNLDDAIHFVRRYMPTNEF